MKLSKKWHEAYRQFSNDPPGIRFMLLHQRHHTGRKSGVLTLILIILGVLFILVGTVFGLIPGVPGILFVLVGVALIAAQVRGVARWCDIIEVAVREVLCRWRSERDHRNSGRGF